MKKMKVSDRAVEYILTRRVEDLGRLTGMKIATAVGVSQPYLSRKFKNDHKITLDEFITREKIHTAIFMLEKNREKPIEELATQLGFMKTDQFVNAFKSYVAIEPQKYRQLRNS